MSPEERIKQRAEYQRKKERKETYTFVSKFITQAQNMANTGKQLLDMYAMQ